MSRFVQLFDRLAATTKVNEKKAILADFDVEDLRLLKVALDRQVNYYVTRRTVKVEGLRSEGWDPYAPLLNIFHQLCEDLSKRNITGHEAIRQSEQFFQACTKDEARILSKVLFREAIGVDAKLVNSVHKNLIPEFNVMLAPNELPKDLAKDVTYPKMVQPKLDGFRCVAFVNEDGSVDMVTRNGKTVKNPIIKSKVENALRGCQGYVFDGEIYRHGWKLKKIMSIATTEEPEGQKAADSQELTLNLWDVMTASEWAQKKTIKPYDERYAELHSLVTPREDVLQVVDSTLCLDAEHAEKLNRHYVSCGYEGVMLKDPDAGYAWKRSTLKQGIIVKVKQFETGDFEVIGYEEGDPTGKHRGTLGRLTVSLRGHPVGVGSGFDDDERDEIWADRENVIGKTVEVRYFEEIETNGKPSLWHPTFLRFREDK